MLCITKIRLQLLNYYFLQVLSTVMLFFPEILCANKLGSVKINKNEINFLFPDSISS